MNIKPWRIKYGTTDHPAFAPLYYYFETLGELSEWLHEPTREIDEEERESGAALIKVQRRLRRANEWSVDGLEG